MEIYDIKISGSEAILTLMLNSSTDDALFFSELYLYSVGKGTVRAKCDKDKKTMEIIITRNLSISANMFRSYFNRTIDELILRHKNRQSNRDI